MIKINKCNQPDLEYLLFVFKGYLGYNNDYPKYKL